MWKRFTSYFRVGLLLSLSLTLFLSLFLSHSSLFLSHSIPSLLLPVEEIQFTFQVGLCAKSFSCLPSISVSTFSPPPFFLLFLIFLFQHLYSPTLLYIFSPLPFLLSLLFLLLSPLFFPLSLSPLFSSFPWYLFLSFLSFFLLSVVS
jgi:hypothetical protein